MTQKMQRNDHGVQARVADELLYAPNVEANLSVTVNDGVVTLAGDVSSLPERLAAIQAAEQVWGVKTVRDEIHVRNGGASAGRDIDIDIARAAAFMLDWSVDVPPGVIRVEVRNRVITLAGVVTWDFQREAASRAVTYIRDVVGVINMVALSPNASVPDVQTAVEDALRRRAPLDVDGIAVEIDGHELILHGNVRSRSERQQAEHAAWAAAGVANVRNELFITS